MARRQPVWPRLLGVLCLGLAVVTALHPVDPMPTHVATSSSARPVPDLAGRRVVALAAPRLVRPVGPQPEGVERFEWEPVSGATGHTLVLLDPGYGELARREVGATGWSADGEMKVLLGQGRVFHWFVLSQGKGGLARSPIESFEQP